MNEKNFELLLKNAYRKMKSYAYFDKTQSVIKKQIIDFESSKTSIDKFIKDFSSQLVERFNNNYIEDWLDEINILLYPKKIKNINNNSNQFASNLNLNKNVVIEDYQSFIFAPLQVHLLGFLWSMTIGSKVDESFGDSLYGNRIRENFKSEKAATGPSPYLMKPYFEQYETWRDKGLGLLENELKNNKDALMINLDLTRFYYNVDMSQADIKNKVLSYSSEYLNIDGTNHSTTLTLFMWQIMEKYTTHLKKIDMRITSKCILPIGFNPSAILSNLYLLDFDNQIMETKPIYYGRYVDDILILYSVNNPELITNKIREISTSSDDKLILKETIEILNYLYCSDGKTAHNKWHHDTSNDKPILAYKMNDGVTIRFNSTKAKLFHFTPNASFKMIEEFKKHIWENKSEFRLVPEDIFDLDYNKLTKSTDLNNIKIEGVFKKTIDKFELSKFIGKNLHIAKEMQIDSSNHSLNDLKDLLDDVLIIDIYLMWESIFTLYIISQRTDLLFHIVDKILHSLAKLNFESEMHKEVAINLAIKKRIVRQLFDHLCTSLARSLSLIAFDESKTFFLDYSESILKAPFFLELTNYIDVNSKLFRKFNMTNKTFFNIPPSMLNQNKIDSDSKGKQVSIFEFYNVLKYIDLDTDLIKSIESAQSKNGKVSPYKQYFLFPYNISLLEIQFIKLFLRLHNNKWSTNAKDTDVFKDIWLPVNGYSGSSTHESLDGYLTYKDEFLDYTDSTEINKFKRIFTYNEGFHFKECLVGIGNVRIDNYATYFDDIRLSKFNITPQRFCNLSEAINTAIKFKSKKGNRTNLFVLPEAFVPIVWLPNLVNISKKNDMAIIVGLEHLKFTRNGKDEYYNFIVSIFPVKLKNFSIVNVNFHLKVHYSPLEIKEFAGQVISGNTYEMHKWRGLNIAPYCCYELTSIQDRSIFKNDDVNTIAAIVFNRDVEYFSNIVESLSRDLNSFVIQANDSLYGDSRIFQPAKSIYKNLMRFSGGINHTALISELELDSLKKHLKRPLLIQMDDIKWKSKSPQ
jgi:hypothetical protein